MRVLLFSSPGWGTLAIEQLVANGHRVVGLCCRPPASPLRRLARPLRRSVRGWAGRSRTAWFYGEDPFADLMHPRRVARRLRIPWIDPKALGSAKGVEVLQRLRPEVAFVAGFPRRIPQDLAQVPPCGTINFHPSLLPAHRGGTPTRWTILRGERMTGVTAHLVTEALDAGDLLCAKTLEVGEDETWGSLERRAASLAAALLCELAAELAVGRRPAPVPQDQEAATYERPFRQADSVMDWAEPLELTMRRCRAAKPKWGGIFGLHGRPFCAWSVERAEAPGPPAAPGTITRVSPGRWLEVACADGLLRITHLLSEAGDLVSVPRHVGDRAILPGDRCEPSTVVRRWVSPHGELACAATSADGHRATLAPASR